MKKLALILIALLILPLAFAVEEETETANFDLVAIAHILNNETIEIPRPFSNFVGNGRLNIYVDEDVLAITLQADTVTEASNTPLPNPTIEVYTSHETINALYDGEMKASKALKTKAIDIKGIGAWNGLKVGFLKIGLRLIANRLDNLIEDETVGERIRAEKGQKKQVQEKKEKPNESINSVEM